VLVLERGPHGQARRPDCLCVRRGDGRKGGDRPVANATQRTLEKTIYSWKYANVVEFESTIVCASWAR
jgi:hypothetical protein